MSKTSRSKRTAATPAPRPEQLTAVRRLAESGRVAEARQRLAALKLAHPDFKPLLGLACEIEWLTDQLPIVVAARAWAWHQASPNSRAALEALRDSARRAGLIALQARAVQGLRSLELGRPVPLDLAPIDGPAGLMTPEQAEANDLARMHLADNNPAAAVVVLRGLEHPSARNNLVMALFSCGEVAAACAEAEAAWQADPANLFALERYLRWHCWQHGLASCSGFAATLQASVPRRPEDANARIAALRFLGDTEGAKAAWADVQQQDYWQLAAPEQIELFKAQREAGLQTIDMPGERMLWLPLVWVNALSRVSQASRTSTEDVAQAQWDACLDTCDAHLDYLQRAGEQGDKAVRLMAQAVLKRRAKQADAAALAVLTTWLTSLGGPDEDRMKLLQWLKDEGLIGPTEAASTRIGGVVRPMRTTSMTITTEPRPVPYSPAGTLLAERMFEAIDRKAWPQAHELAQLLHQMHPEQVATLTNLASVKQALGEPPEVIRQLYEQARAQAPDYLYARCGLAVCLAGEGRIDEARALLDGLLERDTWHYSEYRSFLLAQRAMAQAMGEPQVMQKIDHALHDLQQRFDR